MGQKMRNKRKKNVQMTKLQTVRLFFSDFSSHHCATILQVHDYAKTQPCVLGRMKRDNYFPSYADMLRGVIKMEMIHYHQHTFLIFQPYQTILTKISTASSKMRGWCFQSA